MTVNKEKFLEARCNVLGEYSRSEGIGTLSERSLHRTLKFYYEPNKEFHEVKYLGSVADIKNKEGITEIQTKAFKYLVPKLKKFLKEDKVTVVYPLAANKTIRMVNKKSGEISPPRKSPMHENIYSAFYEIYNIREFLNHPNFTLRIALLDVEEYRYSLGKGRRGERIERMANNLIDEIEINSAKDFIAYIPKTLNPEFTSAELAKAMGIRKDNVFYIINFLREIEIIKQVGKRGRAYVYSLKI